MVAPVLFSTSSGMVPSMPPAQSAPALSSPDRVEAFQNAIARRADAIQAPNAAGNVGGVGETQVASANDRARQGLDLQGAAADVAPPTGGDMILDGIQKMRGVFDAHEARIGSIMNGSTTSATALMDMQMELANFSLLVDVASKLTGKSTQIFDTLMKGQ